MISKLFVLEGPDSVGKTSIATALVARLNSAGEPASYFSFPGREQGTLGQLIYQLHHDSASHGINSVTPTALQALHLAAHLDVIERCLNPLLERGINVVLDRYWWSTFVYGVADNADVAILERLIGVEKNMWRSLPDHVFLLDRTSPIDEDDSPSFQTHRQLYHQLASNETGNYPISKINNDHTQLDALQEIWTKIAEQ
jgi:dTMP kinase